ncbi:sulfite exporter TauE/SafE family protein [Streptomyces orinoci]|uniref:Probable membrane transporter protein n=1 Tax=Streptomyces orinoci TaxID=67339 RepID=A0ABV3JWQ0_STRON|nr:sulfite exporter TauE/SafE family protein [Streptomyces orinoci]
MSIWAAIAVFAAGIGAGTINVIVGSGTLFTFPVLLAAGLPPVTANVSNTLGLVTGNLSGVIGYRRELRGQRRRIIRFGTVALLGGLTGAILLVVLPPKTFAAVVPVLIGLALVLVVLQPRLARALARRHESTGTVPHADGGAALLLGLLLASAYGGYFGAAQGVMYLSLMGLLLADDLQRINALKNVLAVVVNGVAALFFLFAAHIDWRAVLLIAAGSTLGGQLGAKVARRLPPTAMRGVIVLVGAVAITELLLR